MCTRSTRHVTHPSPTINDPRPLRVALIGAGRHAQHHARAILRCPGVQLVAVADPSEPAQAAMRDIVPGIGCFKTPEELLASERPHVVHIITPPVTHAPLAKMALRAGCHIYVESRLRNQQKMLSKFWMRRAPEVSGSAPVTSCYTNRRLVY